MNIRGGPSASRLYWLRHLMNAKASRPACLIETRALRAEQLSDALRELEALDAGLETGAKFMHVAQITPQAGETLTRDQWTAAIKILERNLGLINHQRMIVEEESRRRTRCYVIWSTIDKVKHKTVIPVGNSPAHVQTAREVERRLNLQPNPYRNHDRPPKPQLLEPNLGELRATQRSGIAVEAVRKDMSDTRHMTNTGPDFVTTIFGKGNILVVGVNGRFCGIDQAGDVQSLARRIEGVSYAVTRSTHARRRSRAVLVVTRS